MAEFKLLFRKSVRKDLRKLPKAGTRRLLKRMEKLSFNPFGENCSPIVAPYCHRLRLGMYRVVYEVREDSILVAAILTDAD